MGITSSDIAKMVGVSRSAVSSVLNGHYKRVSREKREKILAIANDLRYRPNPAALGLAKRNTRMVGVLASPFMSSIYSDLLSKLSFTLREKGYACSIVLPEDAEHEVEAIQHFESLGADGLIAAYLINDVARLSHRVPLVSMSPHPGQYELRVDLGLASRLAVEHLREHGHTKVGMICPRLSVVPMQWEGYLATVGEAGAFRLEVTDNPRFGDELSRLLDDEGVRAWTVTNDLLAARVMRCFLSRGYRVPEDVALIGFDGTAFADVTPTPLTTVVFPAARIADLCVDMLLEKIDGNELGIRPEPVLVAPRLHLGGSCGCRVDPVLTVEWSGQPVTLDDVTE